MRYLIPFAAMLLGGLILGLRSAQVRMETGTRPIVLSDQPAGGEQVQARPSRQGAPQLEAPPAGREGIPQGAGPSPVVRIQPNLALVQRNMVSYFHRELGLTAEQLRHFESVLSHRQERIESYHREVRASKVFIRRDYDLRMNEIQASAYERMGAVLDAAQYKRFSTILNERTQGDSIGFALDPEMTIVD